MGDVSNQNNLSFQQPLKRAPPGPFPWGVDLLPEPAGRAQLGEEGTVIKGQVTSGHDVRAAPDS